MIVWSCIFFAEALSLPMLSFADVPTTPTTCGGLLESLWSEQFKKNPVQHGLAAPVAKLVRDAFYERPVDVRNDPNFEDFLSQKERARVLTEADELFLDVWRFRQEAGSEEFADPSLVRPTMLMVHEIGRHKAYSPKVRIGNFYFNIGLNLFMADLSGHGLSERRINRRQTFENRWMDDLLSLVKHAAENDPYIGKRALGVDRVPLVLSTFSISTFIALRMLPQIHWYLDALIIENGPAYNLPLAFRRFYRQLGSQQLPSALKWMVAMDKKSVEMREWEAKHGKNLKRGPVRRLREWYGQGVEDMFVYYAHTAVNKVKWSDPAMYRKINEERVRNGMKPLRLLAVHSEGDSVIASSEIGAVLDYLQIKRIPLDSQKRDRDGSIVFSRKYIHKPGKKSKYHYEKDEMVAHEVYLQNDHLEGEAKQRERYSMMIQRFLKIVYPEYQPETNKPFISPKSR